jgi:hypothetical protein
MSTRKISRAAFRYLVDLVAAAGPTSDTGKAANLRRKKELKLKRDQRADRRYHASLNESVEFSRVAGTYEYTKTVTKNPPVKPAKHVPFKRELTSAQIVNEMSKKARKEAE